MAHRNNKVVMALQACGAIKVRSKRHDVWKLPNGKTYVLSQSPSHTSAERHALHLLKKLLGAHTSW